MNTSQHAVYDDTVVRQFSIMAVVWGVVGMLVGVFVASQLAWPELNFGIPWLSFGRLRPLHTNAVIFAFGGSALFATSYYVVQRTCHTTLFLPKLASFTFWGWQLVILLAAISLPLGYTQGKEYAELEWPIDILIAVVWVAYAVVFFGTIGIRKVKHIYVANWFYGAFIIAVAFLHIVNSAAIPAGFMKSYSALSGAWHRLRDDPVLRFLIVSLSFYGMSTFEGPMMAIKTVNALSHYTDWTVGHVHSGALGWVGLVSMGSIYFLIPRLFGQKTMYSVKAVEVHFWMATIGIVLYIAAMWIAGVMQGLMWRAINADGTLTYTFVESVKATYPFYVLRVAGGLLYLSGMVVMLWNVVKTALNGQAVTAAIPAPAH